MESCFLAKNGTPRQPTICSHSRACLRIRKSIFNNPEHSLMGLEQFSHVWILFVFHKNGHLSCKAKVQPPRLNGANTHDTITTMKIKRHIQQLPELPCTPWVWLFFFCLFSLCHNGNSLASVFFYGLSTLL